jgi:hypothetical protein
VTPPSEAQCPRCNAPIPAGDVRTLPIHVKLSTVVGLLMRYRVDAEDLQWSNSVGALVTNISGVEIYRGALSWMIFTATTNLQSLQTLRTAEVVAVFERS